MLNSKDGFFGKRDEKVRKDVGNVYGMASSSSSTSTSSTPAMTSTPTSSSSASSTAASDAAKARTDSTAARADEGKGNKLIVGPDIKLKGEINDCDTIIVEGRIEATTDSRVLQGSLEDSNVNPVEALTEMIMTMRQFEANAKALKEQSDSAEKLIADASK